MNVEYAEPLLSSMYLTRRPNMRDEHPVVYLDGRTHFTLVTHRCQLINLNVPTAIADRWFVFTSRKLSDVQGEIVSTSRLRGLQRSQFFLPE